MGVTIREVAERLRRRTGDGEAGLTLVELMFAIVIFAIVATSVIAGLEVALKTARLDRNRVAASNLAARELEIVRNQFASSPLTVASTTLVTNPDPLPGGTAGQPLVVDGVPYTVTRNVEWLPAGTGQSPCDGGSAVTYPSLAVQVNVTWSAMGSTKPVSSNTVMTPPKGTLATTMAFVGVKILNSAGTAASGQTVTLTGPGGTLTDTTAGDGCAVFQTTTMGTYTAAINQPGYVDFFGNQNSTKTVVVSAGTLSQLQINYDQAASMRVTMSTTAGYALPTAFPGITFGNTGLQPTGTKSFVATAATTTLSGLWPFTDGYTMWAGSCQQSDPAASGGSRSPAVVVAPAGSGNGSVTLAPVQVTARTALGLPVALATVVAYPVSTTGCASTENPLTLGVTDATGLLKTSVPAGSWRLQIVSKSPSGSWPTTPVLLPTSGPTAVTVNTT